MPDLPFSSLGGCFWLNILQQNYSFALDLVFNIPGYALIPVTVSNDIRHLGLWEITIPWLRYGLRSKIIDRELDVFTFLKT